MPVRIEIFIIFTRVFGSSPSLGMPHGVPSEIRAIVSAKYSGLEIENIIRYGKGLGHLTDDLLVLVAARERVVAHGEAPALGSWHLARFRQVTFYR